MVKPKLTCLLHFHHLDLLERGFEVYKKSNTQRWIKRTYWYNAFEEKMYWNTKKIFHSKENFIYPFQIRYIGKKNKDEMMLELSLFLEKNKYDQIEVIYKTIEWKFEREEMRDEIFDSIQEIRNQYQSDYSIFPKIL